MTTTPWTFFQSNLATSDKLFILYSFSKLDPSLEGQRSQMFVRKDSSVIVKVRERCFVAQGDCHRTFQNFPKFEL